MSASVDAKTFPWLYPYQEDGPRLDSIVFRPIVPASLVGPTGETSPVAYALVDSGCSHVLAAPWLAHACGAEPKSSNRTLQLGIGGSTVTVRFVDLSLRLMAPDGDDSHFIEWDTEVGFLESWKPTFNILVGQSGFMDQVTVTMSHHSRVTAVEERDRFDERYGVVLAK